MLSTNGKIYHKNVVVYSGATDVYKLGFVGTYDFTDETIAEDITSTINSNMSVYDPDKKIKKLDIVFFRYCGRKYFGRITAIDSEDAGLSKLTLVLNQNSFDNQLLFQDTNLDGVDESVNNNQVLNVELTTADKIIIDNNLVSFDTLIQKSMQQSPKVITLDKTGTEFFVHVSDSIAGEVSNKIKLSAYSDVVETYATEEYNKLILYNQDDLTKSAEYYLNYDGTITTSVNDNVIVPFIEKSEIVEAENYNNLDYVTSKFNEQRFDSNIQFSFFPTNSTSAALLFDDYFLSKRVRVYSDKLGIELNTIISAYSIEDGKIKVTLGLTRKELSIKLNKKLKGNNGK